MTRKEWLLEKPSFNKDHSYVFIIAPILESISNPPGGEGWSWDGCGCQKDPISDQIPTCLVPRIGGIKLQLLCGVRIELA